MPTPRGGKARNTSSKAVSTCCRAGKSIRVITANLITLPKHLMHGLVSITNMPWLTRICSLSWLILKCLYICKLEFLLDLHEQNVLGTKYVSPYGKFQFLLKQHKSIRLQIFYLPLLLKNGRKGTFSLYSLCVCLRMAENKLISTRKNFRGQANIILGNNQQDLS